MFNKNSQDQIEEADIGNGSGQYEEGVDALESIVGFGGYVCDAVLHDLGGNSIRWIK